MDQSDTPSKQLDNYISRYIDDNNKNDELEVVFGNRLSRIDFENVIKKLKSIGFQVENANGKYHLNIQNQFIDKKTGRTNMSAIRTTVEGIKNIQDYCKSNILDPELTSVIFMQKVIKKHYDDRLPTIHFNDFGFRVNYKEEKILKPKFGIIKGLLESWNNNKKIFRLIKRFTLVHPEFPVKIDCSIVRSSERHGNRLIPEYRIENSNIFNNPETYEIEIELDHLLLPPAVTSDEKQALKETTLSKLKQTIKFVLSGLQETNYPISYIEQRDTIDDYMHILYKNPPERRVRNRDFVGPSSISLERPNIIPLNEDTMVANIRGPYTITEKADGARKLLFINKKGKIYLIDINMKIQFTGCKCKNIEVFNTIIDGEHVLHNKEGDYINQYLAFDLYYLNKKDVRHNAFIITGESQTGRLILLNKCIKGIDIGPLPNQALKIRTKEFLYSDQNDGAIFKNCKTIFDRVKDGLFEYETDGLIFTPADKGVGGDKIGETYEPIKKTWIYSLKWKPPSHNTIDFLVTTVKNETGNDVIQNIFEKGSNVSSTTNLTQYKTLQLRVGFDEGRHGYLNPCEDVIQDRLPQKTQREERSNYKPVPFYPSNPTPQFPAYLCNIVLEYKGEYNGETNVMTIEDKSDVIEDETIVEFRYDQTRDKFWQWVPIRVRQDKTADYRSGGRNYGNAYHVAQSVWNSIHNPVTEEMLTTGENIPDLIAEDDIYYNKKETATTTRSLRDFHNLYVKRVLILAASKFKGTLIDMSVGKAGDFSKWIAAKLSFVFGLDIARDNIENRLNGACARFLNYRKQYRSVPYSLFLNANSALNIRSGEACFTDKGREITRAIFGDGPKDEKKLGRGVFRQYGKGKDGFDVVSNQFSIHYFAETPEKFHNFLRNVSECCKVGGYFIGTSYDGRKVFQKLEDKKLGESITISTKEGERIWEITKQYNSQTFENNATSLGYRVDVYQESINKVFSEYLVNYDYLISTVENYGFMLVERDELDEIGLPNSVGNFEQLYYQMKSDLQTNKIRRGDIGTASQMNHYEKEISYLNKYFIFKKVRDVNAETVSKGLINASPQHGEDSKQMVSVPDTDVPKIKKKKKKIKIQQPKEEQAVKIPIDETDISKKVQASPIILPPGNIIKSKKTRRKKKIVIID
jgi:hypothetical protein